MEINKRILLSLLLVTALVFSFGIVSSAAMTVTINDPVASTAVNGTVVINVTATAPIVNWTCNVYAQSSSTANSTWATLLIGSAINNGTATEWNSTFDSTDVEDATDYTINVSCNNGTGTIVGDTNTNVIFDNTIPTASTSLVPTSDTDGTVTMSGTVTGTMTTACTLWFSDINPGSKSYAMTHTGDNCSYALTNLPEQTYKWFIEASDGSNKTNSSVQTTNVDVQTSAGKSALLNSQPGVTSEGGALFSVSSSPLGDIEPIWIAVIVVIGIVVVFIIRKR